jgi:hypothetical protein
VGCCGFSGVCPVGGCCRFSRGCLEGQLIAGRAVQPHQSVAPTTAQVWESFWNFSGSSSSNTQGQPPESGGTSCPAEQEQQQQQEPSGSQPIDASGEAPKEGKPELLGLDVWPAAVRLCEYLSSCPHLVAGLDVAELGAGALFLLALLGGCPTACIGRTPCMV